MKFLQFVSLIFLCTILMSEKIFGKPQVEQIQEQEIWKQGCQSQNNSSVDLTNTPIEAQCGRRNFDSTSFDPRDSLDPAENIASPGEFPWLCLLFTGTNRFLGGCAIVPDNKNNDISQGATSRVITAQHKLSSLTGPESLIVRIIKQRPSTEIPKPITPSGGSNFFDLNSENSVTEDYTVVKIIGHPGFNKNRIIDGDNISVLIVEQPIQLSSKSGVNAACYPQCENMFDHVFSNGTGTRCWVAGYGRKPGSETLSFVQQKVDIPIFPDRTECNKRLINASSPLKRSGFELHPGDICAGGEEGKDKCDGAGGAPLVCQSETGQWHVVGLTSWGVGCGTNVPGVYVNVFHYLDFITKDYS